MRGGGPGRLPVECKRPALPLLRQAKNEDAVAIREAELEVAAGRDGDELLTVDLERDRGGVDAGAALEPPELFAGLGVERVEVAGAVAAGEDHAPRRGEGAADQRVRKLVLPGDLPRVDVDRSEGSPLLLGGDRDEGAPEPELPAVEGGRVRDVVHRLMQ